MDPGKVSQASGLEALVAALTTERDQLVQALETRIVIEQAKGVLAERFGLTVEDAFLLLRTSARRARTNIHRLAEDVVGSRETPEAILRGMARDNRLRAASTRTAEVRTAPAEQIDPMAHWAEKPTARIRVDTRSDAVDLASRLGGYRWYLIVPDEDHWEVVVEFSGPPSELPADLRTRIDHWLGARGLQSAHVRLGDIQIELSGPA